MLIKVLTGRPWTGTKCWGKVLMRFHGLLGQGFLGKPLWFWGSIDFGLMSPGPCELRRLTCCLAHLTQFAWVAEERCALWSGKGRRGAVFLAVGYYYRRLWWLALRCQVIYFSKNGLHLPLLQCLGCLLKLICCSVEGHDVWQLVDLSQRVWVYHLMYNF